MSGHDRHHSRHAINHIVVTVNRSKDGHLDKLPIGFRSTSRMTNPWASLTKPCIKLFTFRVEALSGASWIAVYVLGGRYAYREPGLRLNKA